MINGEARSLEWRLLWLVIAIGLVAVCSGVVQPTLGIFSRVTDVLQNLANMAQPLR